MTELPRLRPEPIPAIHPLPEYLAEGRRKAWYEDMKQIFQVPWMGVVTMAYAHYPNFYETLWQGVRDLCASRPFVEGCLGNRAFVETEVAKLDPAPIGDRLGEIGYARREIEAIHQIIEVFSHGNQPYVVLATITRYLLEAGDVGGTTDPEAAPPYVGRHAPPFRCALRPDGGASRRRADPGRLRGSRARSELAVRQHGLPCSRALAQLLGHGLGRPAPGSGHAGPRDNLSGRPRSLREVGREDAAESRRYYGRIAPQSSRKGRTLRGDP